MATEQQERRASEEQDALAAAPQPIGERVVRVEVQQETQGKQLDRMEGKVDALDAKIDNTASELRADNKALSDKVDTQFRWLVGLLILILLSVIGVGATIAVAIFRVFVS